jgi:hypothetical protein
MVQGGSFPGGKAAKAWSWSPTSFTIQELVALYLHPQYVYMAWCLVKHTDNFTFTYDYNITYCSV